MGLSYSPDTAAADWIVQSATPPMQLITFGPAGYEAYARLRYIADPSEPGQHEADVQLPEGHPSDMSQARSALRVLAGFTRTPEDSYFCLWAGYSDTELPPEVSRGPLVDTPHRRYALLRGSLHDIDSWEADICAGGHIPPPALAWPADHSWCFASDVDPHWAGVGAELAAVEALMADPELDVVPAEPTERQPAYY